MQSFEQIRSYLSSKHTLKTNDPYLVSFDLKLGVDRHQGIYFTELEAEGGQAVVRISTPLGPLVGIDATRCLRFNWEQRLGYLAVSDLDGSPYLHLCENRCYALLTAEELDRLVSELGALGDQLEHAISNGGDLF